MPGQEIPKTPVRFLWFLAKPYVVWTLPAIAFVTVAQLLSSTLPFIMKQLVDAVTAGETLEEQAAALSYWSIVYIVLLALAFSSWRGSGFFGIEWLTRAKAYGYQTLYGYLTLHSHTYFVDHFAGALSNKVSNAADGADRMAESILWQYYPNILALIASNALLYISNMYLGIVFSTLVAVLFAVNVLLVRRRRPYVIAYAEASSTLRGVGVDLLSNIANMRQFAMRPFEIMRLDGYITDRRLKDTRRARSGELGLLLNCALVTLALVIILLITWSLFSSGEMTLGQVVLITMLIFNTSYALIFIGNMLNSLIRDYGEIEEGLRDILVAHQLADERQASALEVTGGRVEFKDVDFSYEQQAVFITFNTTIEPCEKIGLVGTSGAGKTTFVSLLLRQHDIGGGEIRIDGQNIKKVTQDSLRRAIAVVPQEPLLFHRSIRENIAYGKTDATDAEIAQATKLAQAHDFIVRLPKGYDTLVGERGVKLSGGQRQRVAIARAILKNAPILVLDEATSSLDSESEVAIQKALHELMEGKTVIAIAHRLSTLREMNRIIVLDEGKIAEEGTHNELVKSGGIYSRLWDHQAGGFLQD